MLFTSVFYFHLWILYQSVHMSINVNEQFILSGDYKGC